MSIERLHPALDALVDADARLEVLADGFAWSEGPVWRDGGLLFNDIPRNTTYRWTEREGLRVFLRPSGHTGSRPPGRELGSNGTTLDAEGRLVMCDHGNRQVARLDNALFTKTTLADRYDGRRFNSPNDCVYRSNGDLYFTDPPYGLDGLNASPLKELPFNGVYRVAADGVVSLIVRDLTFPNGLAFSPDERTLYVAVSDAERPLWMAYDVRADGTVENGHVFFDAGELSRAGRSGLPDGMKIDRAGNVFATGPGGVLVLSSDGVHLGTIVTPQTAANCAWGDDGFSLYVTASSQLLRVRLRTRGSPPGPG